MKPGQYHRLLSDGLGGGGEADPFALTKPTDTRPTVAPSSSLSSSSPSSSSLRTEASSPGDRPWPPHPHHPCPHRQCHWPTPVHGPPPPHSHLRGLSGQTQRFTDGDSAMRPATRPEPRTMDHQPPSHRSETECTTVTRTRHQIQPDQRMILALHGHRLRRKLLHLIKQWQRRTGTRHRQQRSR